MLVSRLTWPNLSAFPELFTGHPLLSLTVYGALVAFGVIVRRRLAGRISMAVYAATLGIALCAAFTIVDLTLTAYFGR